MLVVACISGHPAATQSTDGETVHLHPIILGRLNYRILHIPRENRAGLIKLSHFLLFLNWKFLVS